MDEVKGFRRGVRSCPSCGSHDVRPIVFGLPGPEMTEAGAGGEIYLGGCFAPPSELGQWDHCMSCNQEFHHETGQSLDAAYEEYMAR